MKVVLYGPFEKMIGRSSVDIPCESELKVSQILSHISERYPAFQNFLTDMGGEDLSDYILLTVNSEVADAKTIVKRDDTVKIFLPTVGG